MLGIYECAYRLFGTNDIVTNTTGAALGWLLAALPGVHRLAYETPTEQARLTPRPVSRRRRVLGMTVDWLSVSLSAAVLEIALRVLAVLVFAVPVKELDAALPGRVAYLAVLAGLVAYVAVRGRTPGDDAVLLEYRSTRGEGRGSPVVIRLARFFGGIGTYALLGAFAANLADLFALALVVTVLVAPARGLPGLVAPIRVADQRATRDEGGPPLGSPPSLSGIDRD